MRYSEGRACVIYMGSSFFAFITSLFMKGGGFTITNIKVKGTIKKPNHCYDCPFLASVDGHDQYGEFDPSEGYEYCTLTNGILDIDWDDDDDPLPKECPIIEISIEEES